MKPIEKASELPKPDRPDKSAPKPQLAAEGPDLRSPGKLDAGDD